MVGVPQMQFIWSRMQSHEYNCSIHMPPGEEWSEKYGTVNHALGLYFIMAGLLCELAYVPCIGPIYAHSKSPCYKIMLWLCFADIVALGVTMMFGSFLYMGAVHCSFPAYSALTGALSVGSWCASCLGCCLLVFDRLLEIQGIGHYLEGKRVWFALALTTLYGFYFGLFSPPFLPNSTVGADFSFPCIPGLEEIDYTSFATIGNNIIVALINSVMNISVCVLVTRKKRMIMDKSVRGNDLDIKMYLQIIFISASNITASYLYVFENFVTVSPALIIIGNIAWQFNHGAPPFIYLLMNRTVQNHLKESPVFGKIFRLIRPRTQISRIKNEPTKSIQSIVAISRI